MLATVGNQIAVAIERARLFGQMEAQVRERTEAWQAERKLLSAVVNTSGALVCMVDTVGVIRLFNPACEAAMGWPAAEAIGRPCWEVFRKAGGSPALEHFFSAPPQHTRPSQVRGQWLARDGAPRAIIWSTTWLRKPDDTIEYFLGTGVDVTELRGAEEKVRYLSSFDALTGLPNRMLLRECVRGLQQSVAAGGQVLGFVLLELERLRLIGENLGNGAEQAMVVQVAARLQQWERGGASVARIGERRSTCRRASSPGISPRRWRASSPKPAWRRTCSNSN